MKHQLSIAHSPKQAPSATRFSQAVQDRFPDLEIEMLSIDEGEARRPSGAVVALLFDQDFSNSASRVSWLTMWTSARASTPLLPIAINPGIGRPPEPISGLKARFLDSDLGAILTTIGALMGLALRPQDSKLFISYRMADGAKSAKKLAGHLSSHGYVAWLDEESDVRGRTNLNVGDDVQQVIEKELTSASAVIVVDTPGAPSSEWIEIEIQLAIGKMIPVFPIVLHPEDEETSSSRFRVLQGLQRRSVVKSSSVDGQLVIPDEALEEVSTQLEGYLQKIYQNRVVEPRNLEQAFLRCGWQYGPNELIPYLHSGQIGEPTSIWKLLACCSFEDTVFTPRVLAFVDDVKSLAAKGRFYGRNFFLHPGAALSPRDRKYLVTREAPDLPNTNSEVLSYNEIAARVQIGKGHLNG
jgi:hypothetical protein